MSGEVVVRLAARGDGVTAAGCFVALAAPGDSVAADGGITPGPHRQTPPCVHFPQCGGCQLQHIDDESYADFVAGRIVEVLASQGIAVPVLRPVHLSPPAVRRRMTMRAMRAGKRVMLGFNEGSSHRIIDLKMCAVLHPSLIALVAPLRGLMAKLDLGKRVAEVRMTLADQGVDLSIAGVEAEGLEAAEALTDFAQRHKLVRLSLDEGYGPAARWEPEPVTVTLSGVAVPLPEGAFLQATADAESVLAAAAIEAVGDAAQVADLFAGLGTFSFALGRPVHAVEGARDAVLALQTAANRARKPVTSEHRDLFRRPLTSAELTRFDAVVLDPPRAGAKEQVAALAASGVPRIAYVSCNPATFARDARILIDGGYRLDWIKPVGQFRWSTHVELAAAFTRQ